MTITDHIFQRDMTEEASFLSLEVDGSIINEKEFIKIRNETMKSVLRKKGRSRM